MRYNAVIFDLDGTLLDTLEDLAAAGNRVLAGAGLPVHPVERYRYFVGEGLRVLIERIVPPDRHDPGLLAGLVAAFSEDYGRNWHVRTRVYDGVPELLTALASEGVSLNVLSNKPHAFTLLCVRELLPHWRFQEVSGLREGMARKPDPGGALRIAERIGLPPAEILYLGDTATDMRTAVAAGMHPVGALWGFRTAGELRESGAAVVATHPLEVLKVLRGEPLS